MKRRMLPRGRGPLATLALITLVVAAASLGCGAKKPLPPVEPQVEQTTTDAGAAEPVDAAPSALYDRLGGKDGVDAVVDILSKNLLADPRVNKLFKKSKDGLSHFKESIASQICQLAGGPCQYAGKDMKDAHHAMGITDAQFDALVEDLKLALDEKGATEQDKSELFAALAPMRADIVEKAGGDTNKKGHKK